MIQAERDVQIPVRQRVAAAKRIVIKLGTNVLMRDDGGAAVSRLYGLVESAVNVRRQGKDVIFVSSGGRLRWGRSGWGLRSRRRNSH